MRGVSFAAVAALAPCALGDVVVFEPDNYAAGTDLSSVVAGITLSALQTSGLAGFVQATDSVFAVNPLGNIVPSGTSTGSLSFGHDASRFSEWTEVALVLRADFSFAPGTMTGVSIDIHGNNGDPVGGGPAGAAHEDFGFLEAYDSSGTLIQRVENSTALLHNEFTTLSISATNIAYILAGGQAATGDALVLDNLQVTLIPLPTGAALAGVGLAGLGALRLTRRRA